MAPFLVISLYAISATITGFTQVTSAFGGSGLKRDGLLYSGIVENGQDFTLKGFTAANIFSCMALLNPVPTGVRKRNSPSSKMPISSALNNLLVPSFLV